MAALQGSAPEWFTESTELWTSLRMLSFLRQGVLFVQQTSGSFILTIMYNKDSPASDSSSADPAPLLDNDQLQGQSGPFGQDISQQKGPFKNSLSKIRATTFDEVYYTVDDAISKIGNGKFQYRLMMLTGGIWAGSNVYCPPHMYMPPNP